MGATKERFPVIKTSTNTPPPTITTSKKCQPTTISDSNPDKVIDNNRYSKPNKRLVRFSVSIVHGHVTLKKKKRYPAKQRDETESDMTVKRTRQCNVRRGTF